MIEYPKYDYTNAIYDWADSHGNKLLKIGKHFEIIEKEIPQIIRKENNMSLTIGTWVCIIIVSFIVAKIAYRTTLKKIFSPMKRIVSYIKSEWKEA